MKSQTEKALMRAVTLPELLKRGKQQFVLLSDSSFKVRFLTYTSELSLAVGV